MSQRQDDYNHYTFITHFLQHNILPNSALILHNVYI